MEHHPETRYSIGQLLAYSRSHGYVAEAERLEQYRDEKAACSSTQRGRTELRIARRRGPRPLVSARAA